MLVQVYLKTFLLKGVVLNTQLFGAPQNKRPISNRKTKGLFSLNKELANPFHSRC
jgi:hypothetical protein